MTGQELAGCYFMLFFGVSMMAMIATNFALLLIDAHISTALIVDAVWITIGVATFLELGLA